MHKARAHKAVVTAVTVTDAELVTRAAAQPGPARLGQSPGDTYGWHAHGCVKVLYCIRGGIVFHADSGDADLGPGARLVLPPHTVHAATVGAEGVCCVEGRPSGLDVGWLSR